MSVELTIRGNFEDIARVIRDLTLADKHRKAARDNARHKSQHVRIIETKIITKSDVQKNRSTEVQKIRISKRPKHYNVRTVPCIWASNGCTETFRAIGRYHSRKARHENEECKFRRATILKPREGNTYRLGIGDGKPVSVPVPAELVAKLDRQEADLEAREEGNLVY